MHAARFRTGDVASRKRILVPRFVRVTTNLNGTDDAEWHGSGAEQVTRVQVEGAGRGRKDRATPGFNLSKFAFLFPCSTQIYHERAKEDKPRYDLQMAQFKVGST